MPRTVLALLLNLPVTLQNPHGKIGRGDFMVVTIQLPADVEQRLRAECADLDSEAKETMLVGLYRQEKLSRYELSLALGLTRFETDALLKKHRVTEDLPTPEELEEDLRRARELFGR